MLAHTNMGTVSLDHPVNVMITPQFYTVKKEVLPVKYAYQAKKIAPSLFEGLLEDEGTYEYFAFKEEETEDAPWVFIAYDIQKITDFLENKGVVPDKISKIFFAQQALGHVKKGSLSLGDDALTVIDDTVVVVPRMALGTETILSSRFSNDFTPKSSGIKAKAKPTEKSDLLTQTQALSIATILALFAGIFIVEGSRYSGNAEAESEELSALYKQHSYLQSSYTRDAAMDKYKEIDTKERQKREAIKACSKMIFKGVTLEKLTVSKTQVLCRFHCTDTTGSNRVKALANKYKEIGFKAKGNKQLTIEAKL